MARIAKIDLEQLKGEISVERLVQSSGIKLEQHSGELIGRCPFHVDDGASLIVSSGSNTWRCAVCGAAGGPVEWVVKKNGVSLHHAAELLREGMASIAGGPVKRTRVRGLPSPVSFDADDELLLAEVVDYYHHSLKQSPDGLAYLQSRGLTDPAIIDTFKLGFANRTLGLRLPNKQRMDGANIRARLERIGLYRKSGHEHFNGSLVIPIMDDAGRIVDLYGRKIRDNLRKGTPKHLWLSETRKGVFNHQGVRQGNGEVILAASLIDALTFWCAGHRSVTAVSGGELSPDLLSALYSLGTRRIALAFSREAVVRIADQLSAAGFECFRIPLPKGMDTNAYALQSPQGAAKSLGNLIRRAEWIGPGTPPMESREALIADGKAALPEKVAESPSIVEVHPAPMPPAPEGVSDHEPGTLMAEANRESSEPLPYNPDSEIQIEEAGDPLSETSEPIDPAGEPLVPARVMGIGPTHSIDQTQVNDREVTVTFGDRRYRVRGLTKNTSYELMRVNVLATNSDGVHVDTFDLYASKARQIFARIAAVELETEEGVIQRDLGRLLLKLEELQDVNIQAAMKPKAPSRAELAKADEEEAVALLRDPNLTERIVADFDRTGLVGEPLNALIGYLAAVSRLLKSPLAIIVQSTSAAGKSALMEAVLRLVPEEDRVHYSAMTGQSLFYLGEKSLTHKILAIAEEEGVRQAAYALKLLQSQGELTIASTGKDPDTGLLITQEYHVQGPVMLFLTTTAIDLDEELLNRCLVLTIDESREQTRAIQARQRMKRTLAGLLAEAEAEEVTKLHRNAQRLLRPLAVVNPFADRLAFLDMRTRTRRDHQKYLTLIDAIALLHQHQREIKSVTHRGAVIEYIEVTEADIALANRLVHETLGRSLDELPPQTRLLLATIIRHVDERSQAQGIARSEVRFTRRELRERVGTGDTQLKLHLARLAELEYLAVIRAEHGYAYELLYAGDSQDTQSFGLIKPEPSTYDADRSGPDGELSGSGRGKVGPKSAGSRSLAGALEHRECSIVRVKHHLLRLARIGPHEQHPAVTEPDVSHLHRHRHAAQEDDFVAPVELVGFARREDERDIGRGRPVPVILAPAPGVAPHRVVAAVVAEATQLLEQTNQRQAFACRLPFVHRQQLIEPSAPRADLGQRLRLALVTELRRPRPDDLANDLP